MLQNLCKTLGFKKNIVSKFLPGSGGKPYPASGLKGLESFFLLFTEQHKICFDGKHLSQFMRIWLLFDLRRLIRDCASEHPEKLCIHI